MKYIYILIGILILAGGIILVKKNKDAREDQALIADRDFRIEDSKRVEKIFIAHRNGQKVLLKKQADGEWLLNDKYRARKDAVNGILRLMRKIKVKNIPPPAMYEKIFKDIASDGVQVEFYDKNEKKIKAFQIGYADNRGYTTFMVMDGFTKPYGMHDPAAAGTFRPYFDLLFHQWKDKTMLKLDPKQIKTVRMDYQAQRNKSFIIDQSEDGYTVKPFYSTTPVINGKVNEAEVEAYLEEFKSKGAEAVLTDLNRLDSLQQSIPFAVLEVEMKNGELVKRDVYTANLKEYNDYQKTKTGRTTQGMLHYYVYDGDVEELYHAQDLVLGKLFVSYDFFFNTTGTAPKED